MRNLVLFGLLVLFLVAAQYTSAQTVDEVINKYIDSLGGAAKLQSLKTVRMEGSMSANGTEVEIVQTKSHMVGHRVDISVMGMSGYQIYTPAKGWSFMPFAGQTETQEMTEDQLKASSNSYDVQGNLYNYKEKGNQLELLGKETIDGTEAYKIKATLKSGKIITYYISTKSYHVIKSSSMQKGRDGADMEMSTSFSNFRQNEDGFTFPYTTVGIQGETNYTKIETNQPVDEKIFTPN